GGELAAPSTAREEVLAAIWAEVLGLERVGVDDGFFELGGDSILSIQVVARAQQAGLKITAKQIFEHQTVAQLALVAETAAHLDAEQGAVAGEAPLTPIQRRFFAAEPEEPHHFTMPLLFALREALEPRALDAALAALATHHDVLRLRFSRDRAGEWRQHHAEPGDGVTVPASTVDLSGLAEPHRRAALEGAAAGLQTSLDLAAGPVLRAVVFRFGDGDAGRLLLVAHHLVVDGVSWRLLIEDLHHAYERSRSGAPLRLPPKTTSFRGWSERLAAHATGEALGAEAGHWIETARAVAAGCPWRIGSPSAAPAGEPFRTELSPETTRSLLTEVHAAYGTRVPDLLLTALARAVAAESGAAVVAVDLEGHGREELFEDADVSRTVGWFTTVYPVVLDLAGREAPGEALKAVKERLRAVPAGGIGYGLLRYAARHPELAGAAEPQIAFNYLGQLDQALPEGSPLLPAAESVGATRSPRQRPEHLLSIDAQVADGRFVARWSFVSDVLSRDRVQALGGRFTEELEALIAHCLDPDAGGFTASDFALTEMGEDELAEAFGEIEFEEF
ncbi:MAG: non-ribosomal peptide synthetase, partial [Acidobacteria bacterium]|nr:non-ribosomal peptide synthetase [Acidobacteriota bacterium]